MKATELRLGNIVAVIDEPSKADMVIVLEPGTVQLMSRQEPDDENNIVPFPLSRELFSEHGIVAETSVSGMKVRILDGTEPGIFTVTVGESTYQVRHMHELQNLVHALCGDELIKHPYIHWVGQSV